MVAGIVGQLPQGQCGHRCCVMSPQKRHKGGDGTRRNELYAVVCIAGEDSHSSGCDILHVGRALRAQQCHKGGKGAGGNDLDGVVNIEGEIGKSNSCLLLHQQRALCAQQCDQGGMAPATAISTSLLVLLERFLRALAACSCTAAVL